MEQTFTSLWNWIFDFINAITTGLNTVIIQGGLTDLKQVAFDLYLLSDSPILKTNLYELLNWFFLGMGFILLYRFFKTFLMIPIRFLKG